MSLSTGLANAQTKTTTDSVILPAKEATVTGKLKILEKDGITAVHYWHNTADIIQWHCKITTAGNYLVRVNYSLDKALRGGRLLVTANQQQLPVIAQPTQSWWDFQTFDLGVIHLQEPGDHVITLKGTQMPDTKDAAFPDIVWLSLIPTAAQVSADVWPVEPPIFSAKKIFDGVSLSGWEGDTGWFRVENGAIVGGNLSRNIPRNEFLATTTSYSNFELQLKVKLTEGKGNGGVQFRSERVTGSREMAGYQADAANGCWGGLYDESRRNQFLGLRLQAEPMSKALKLNDWNAYVIRCEGPRIRVWLNGVLTLDYIEPDPAIVREGRIGLQIHEGAPAEASYKDIELEELPL